MSQIVHAAFEDALPHHRNLPSLARVLIAMAVVVTKWDTLRRTRRTLSQLEPHELKDVGITPGMARKEVQKSFWER